MPPKNGHKETPTSNSKRPWIESQEIPEDFRASALAGFHSVPYIHPPTPSNYPIYHLSACSLHDEEGNELCCTSDTCKRSEQCIVDNPEYCPDCSQELQPEEPDEKTPEHCHHCEILRKEFAELRRKQEKSIEDPCCSENVRPEEVNKNQQLNNSQRDSLIRFEVEQNNQDYSCCDRPDRGFGIEKTTSKPQSEEPLYKPSAFEISDNQLDNEESAVKPRWRPDTSIGSSRHSFDNHVQHTQRVKLPIDNQEDSPSEVHDEPSNIDQRWRAGTSLASLNNPQKNKKPCPHSQAGIQFDPVKPRSMHSQAGIKFEPVRPRSMHSQAGIQFDPVKPRSIQSTAICECHPQMRKAGSIGCACSERPKGVDPLAGCVCPKTGEVKQGCSCHFPPAYAHFSCAGNISGSCDCDLR